MDILESVISIGKRGVEITRFKGLGEMDAKDLFKTTMDPERRELLRVILNDDNAVRADEMFTILMGMWWNPARITSWIMPSMSATLTFNPRTLFQHHGK